MTDTFIQGNVAPYQQRIKELERALKIEREECAKIAEQQDWCAGVALTCGSQIAAKIRARAALSNRDGE